MQETKSETSSFIFVCAALVAFAIIAIAAWGPSTAHLPAECAIPFMSIGFVVLIACFGIMFEDGGDAAMGSVVIGLIVCFFVIPGTWAYQAHEKQTVPFNIKAIHDLAAKHGGRISFASGTVARGKYGSHVEDGGYFDTINKFQRQSLLSNSNVRGFYAEDFEHRILDKYFADQTKTLATGKLVCQANVMGGTLCVQRHASGQYYSGHYTLSK